MRKKRGKRPKASLERQAATKKQRVAEGHCANCGKIREEERRFNWLCVGCAKKHGAKVAKRRKIQATASENLRLCRLCFRNEPVPGLKVCGRCTEERTERTARYRNRNRERGRCTICGDYLTQEELDRGFRNCAYHRAKNLAAQLRCQARRAARLALKETA